MNSTKNSNIKKAGMAATGIGLVAAGFVNLAWPKHSHRRHVQTVYSAEGYGGYVVAPKTPPAVHKTAPDPARASLQTAVDAFNAGRYTDAERGALALVAGTGGTAITPELSASAHQLLAYSAARRHDMKLARVRFQAVAVAAAKLPDQNPTAAAGRDGSPSMMQDAVYQHAVCTAALGDKQAAEAEYVDFMRRYPDSPLLRPCLARIGRLYGGDAPEAARKVFDHSIEIARQHIIENYRRQAMCGPECLAELLRRKTTAPASPIVGQASLSVSHSGALPVDRHADNAPPSSNGGPILGQASRPVSSPSPFQGEGWGAVSLSPAVDRLADEMKTGVEGTTLDNFVDVCQKHGMDAQGVRLTAAGLAEQSLPIVALTSAFDAQTFTPMVGSHYVIVEAVTPDHVVIWDPDAHGAGKSDRLTIPAANWSRIWHGIAVRFLNPAFRGSRTVNA